MGNKAFSKETKQEGWYKTVHFKSRQPWQPSSQPLPTKYTQYYTVWQGIYN